MPAARPSGVRVSMPATSAYLGPGFDALGLAVDLRDELLVRVAGEGVRPGEWSIASYAGVSTGEDNLVLRAMRATFAEVGWTPAELAAVRPAGADVARPGFVRGCPLRGCHGRAGAGW